MMSEPERTPSARLDARTTVPDRLGDEGTTPSGRNSAVQRLWTRGSRRHELGRRLGTPMSRQEPHTSEAPRSGGESGAERRA